MSLFSYLRRIGHKLFFGDAYAPLAARGVERIPGRPRVSHRDKLREKSNR